ncbi:hypothetical protein Tco_1224798, partial [Tanacetum coccineum]
MVRGELGDVLGRWFGLETVGEAGVVLAVNGLRTVMVAGFKEKYGEEAKMAPHFSFS